MTAWDPSTYRADFPVVDRMLFLNHASESPVCNPVRRRIESYLDIAQGDPDAAPVDQTELKQNLAGLLGGLADEYAIMPNTGTGIGLVALGLDWAPGDNVVVPDQEYPANVYPWLALRNRGVQIRRVPLGPGLRINPGDVADRVDHRTRVVAVSAVEYLSGFRTDLAACSRIAHQVDALFVVDGIQAAGACPLNVDHDGIDVLCAGGYKWLLGPIGTGFGYYRRCVWDRITPALPGSASSVKGAEDADGEFELLDSARRYETGCMPCSLLYGWVAGLQILREVGTSAVFSHLMRLNDHLIDGLNRLGYQLASPVDHPGERSGIISFTGRTEAENRGLTERLAKQGIIISLRGGRCRVSPHFYNTIVDIERLLEALP